MLTRPSRFLFSMPNPDDPLESELEDEEDSNGAPPSWFDQLFNQVMGFDKGRSPDYTMRRKEKAGPPRKRPFYHSVAVAPSGSHEDHIHPGAKKRKVESRSTQSHFISPPRPRVRPRLDPDVLEVFSDSEEEEIFRPISVCIGKPLRPPSIPKRASAPDACAPQRQSYPQPSYQENRPDHGQRRGHNRPYLMLKEHGDYSPSHIEHLEDLS